MSEPRPTIQATFTELKKHGIKSVRMVSELGKYGMDVEIINLMVKYDIFPQTYLIRKDVYVSESDVVVLVNRLLLTNMRLYKIRENLDEAKAEAFKYIEDNKIKITDEDLAAIEGGYKTLAQVVEARQAEQTDEPTEAENGAESTGD